MANEPVSERAAALERVKARDRAAVLERVKARDASAAGATGGGDAPLRADMFLQDTVIPTAKAALYAAPIGVADTAATFLGAPASAVSGLASLAGYPQVGEFLHGATIEGQREMLGVPQMRAAQDLDSVPAVPRMAIRGAEMAAGGAVVNAPLAFGLQAAQTAGRALPPMLEVIASNPKAVLKIGAVIDSASGAAGDAAAQIAAALGMDADTQEAGRAWTQFVTAFGGPAALNATKSAFLGFKDVAVPKPQTRINQDVGADLAANRLRDPQVFDTARQNARQFTDQGMKPPPIGSLTGNPVLMAEQDDALRNIPGMARTEQVRQANVDEQIRGTLAEATPDGNVNDVSRGLEYNAAVKAARAQREREVLNAELLDMQTNLLRGKEGVAALIREAGDSLEGAVRTLTIRAEQRATAALDELGEGISARQAGDVFVEELDAVRTEFRQNANRGFGALLGGTDNIPVDTSAIKTAAVTASAPSNPLTATAESVPPVIKAVLDADAPTITPRQLQAVRSKLLNDLRMAQGGANANPQDARKISIVLEAVDSEFERLSNVIPGMDALNGWYREGKQALHGGRFKDVGRELRSRGGVELDPSEVAARFLRADTATGADEAVEQFNRAFGRQLGVDPQPGLPAGVPSRIPSAVALRALDEQIIGQMRLAATDPVTGRVNGLKLAEWVGKHKLALARRPELNAKLSSTAKAQVLADAEVKRIAELKASYERDVLKAAADPSDASLAAQIKAKEREIRDFDRAMRDDAGRQQRASELAIDDPQGRLAQIAADEPVKAAAELRKLFRDLAGDKDAIAGLRAGMWRALTDRVVNPASGGAAPEALVNPKTFAKLLQTHGDLMRELFGPERRALLTEMQRLAKQNVGGGSAKPSLTAGGGEGKVKVALNGLISRAWGIQRGVVGLPYVLTETLARVVLGGKTADLNQAAAQRLLERAIYDPNVYEDLIRLARFPRNRRLATKLAARLSYVRQGVGMALDDRPRRTMQDLRALKARNMTPAPTPATYGG